MAREGMPSKNQRAILAPEKGSPLGDSDGTKEICIFLKPCCGCFVTGMGLLKKKGLIRALVE